MKITDLEQTHELLMGNWEIIKCPSGYENALMAKYFYNKTSELMAGTLTPYRLIEAGGLFIISKYNEQLTIAAISKKYMVWLKDSDAFYILKRI